MPDGLTRFEVQLIKLEQVLNSLPTSSDAALALYKSPARQYLFYLEALTKLYKGIHNKKRFERLRDIFKSLEDQLGRMDYYDGFIKEFSVQENFPQILLEDFKLHFHEELNLLDKMLHQDGWIGPDKAALTRIKEELDSVEWLSGTEDRQAIGEIFISDIAQIKSDYHSGKLNFDDIENGIHEFRRQIRWISIYAQALDGLIQLKKVEVPEPALAAYLTKEVVESPFNVMPVLKKGITPIYIESPHFYALSWLIAESGRLKDEGLRIISLESMLRETHFVSEKEVKTTTRNLAIKNTRSLKAIKALMKVMADKFIYHDKILDRIEKDIRNSI